MSEALAGQPVNEAALKRTDAELATASGAGDPAAFGELVLRHQDRAFNLAFRLTGSPEDAADAVQEAFLKAYRGMPSFRRQSSFYTWLFRILVNEVRSRRRSGAARVSSFSLDAAGGRSAERGDPAEGPAGLDPTGRIRRSRPAWRSADRSWKRRCSRSSSNSARSSRCGTSKAAITRRSPRCSAARRER